MFYLVTYTCRHGFMKYIYQFDFIVSETTTLVQFPTSKRTFFTKITALPASITRQSVLEALYDHIAMINLNPFCRVDHL